MSLVLLDTSALVAPFFHEDGEVQVMDLLAKRDPTVAICAISWFEFRFLLKARGVTDADACETLDLYRRLIPEIFPVDEVTVQRAIELREAMTCRIPMVDALIAGCAIRYGAILVHRDRHLDAIPAALLKLVRVG